MIHEGLALGMTTDGNAVTLLIEYKDENDDIQEVAMEFAKETVANRIAKPLRGFL